MQIPWAVKRYIQAGGGAGAGKCVFSNRSKLPKPLLAVSCIFRFLVLTEVTGESTAAIHSLFGSFCTLGEREREKERSTEEEKVLSTK